ncbi:phosphotransferase enzyme family protein [Kineococcus sp. TBRC 1896]|uniref:Phosphotransferase enzyme family protein n=1 Tax=Kineococcus mangrovi TaxID=1660183 RepID=A0ABV4IA75_9ACTN
MLTVDDVRELVARHWAVGPVDVSSLPGGMNSTTWTVTGSGGRWVAKAVAAASETGFALGLRAAQVVDAAGVPAGAPEPTRQGELRAGTLALLRRVEGAPLTGADPREQVLIGTTLGRAHHALTATTGPGSPGAFPHWVDPGAAHLEVEPWVRPAVRDALARYTALRAAGPPLTCAVLHGDPDPGAFLALGDGDCGLIDWSSAEPGPLLYDLASAALYLGGPDRATALVEAYVATGVLAPSEVERGLDVLHAVRWAVQADYFAHRVVTDDRTGIDDPGENAKGLHDAREFFGSGG